MTLPHLSHAALGWPDVLTFGGAAACVWAGVEMGAGSLLFWAFQADAAVAPPGGFNFSGLAGVIVALTGITSVVTGFVLNLRKARIEELKLDFEKMKADLADANADRAAMKEQLRRTRENVHKTANVVNELNLERQARALTPDPDRSGPQKVVVVNDPGHPVPTEPVKKGGEGA